MLGKERRRYKRHSVEGVRGNVRYLADLKIINISVDGAAIETMKRLDVNRQYSFKIDYKDTPVIVKGLVVWSRLIHAEKTETGDVIPIYRSGVKFLDSVDEKAVTLMSFIEDTKVSTVSPPERRVGVRCKILSSENIKIDFPYEYVVKKISLAGMEIETEHPLAPGSTHDMEFVLDEEAVNLRGRIVSCIDASSGNAEKYNIGVEFIEISDGDKEAIDRFLNTLSES